MSLLQRLSGRAKPLEKVPRGFHPVRWWAEKWGYSTVHTWRLLSEGMKNKPPAVKMVLVRIRTSGKRNAPVPHYAEIKSR
jgi:hypothetical protein